MYHKSVAVTVALISLIFWKYLSIDVPPGIKEQKTYRIRKMMLESVSFFADIGDRFNYASEPSSLRTVFHKLVEYSKKPIALDIKITDVKLNGVNARVYKPNSIKDSSSAPIFIYYHGGAFFIGNPDIFEEYICEISIRLNIVAISVDYRLVPEHPFPIPTNDCFAATKYVLESGDEFGDVNKVILAGDSAGGNIVAAMTQRLKSEKITQPMLQVLIYPWTQMFNTRMPSHLKYGKRHFFVGRGVAWYLGNTKNSKYLGDIINSNKHTLLVEDLEMRKKYKAYTDVGLIPAKYKSGKTYYDKYDETSEETFPINNEELKNLSPEESNLLRKIFTPEFSPGLAENEKLIGLPKALFLMAESDPIKDEGLIYSERLKRSGVQVDVKFHEDAFHGCTHNVNKEKGYGIARVMLEDLISYLKETI